MRWNEYTPDLPSAVRRMAYMKFAPAGSEFPVPFESAIFETTGTRIDSLTNGAYAVPEPVVGQLTLMGVPVLVLARIVSARRSA